MNKKIAAIITAAITMIVMCGAPAVAFAAEGSGVTKEETVYVVTDSTGLQNDVIVSDHLINKSKINTIKDKSALADIENVKGKEKFTQNGDDITWSAGGNDIYYQGRTIEDAPVTLDVRYTLDGKEISGPELQGKSGDVSIKIRYSNNAEYNGTSVPMIALSGIVVTDKSFNEITIDHGKVVDMGDKKIVAGFAAPGLAQSLNVSENDLGFGSSVTIRGKADKFNVKDIMTIVTNDVFDDIDTSELDKLDYDDQIKQLEKGSKQLVSGTKELNDGLQQLNSGIAAVAGTSGGDKGLIPTFESLKEGVPKLSYAAATVDTNLKTISANLGSDSSENTLIWMANIIDNGLNSARSSLTTASDATDKAEKSLNAAEESLNAVKEDLNKSENKAESRNDDIRKTIEASKEELKAIEKGDSNLYDILIDKLDEDVSADADSEVEAAQKQLKDAQKELSVSSEANEKLGDKLSTADSGSGLGTIATYLHNGLKSLQTGISGGEGIPQEQTLLYATGSLNQGLQQMSDTITKATDKKNPENIITALETLKSGSSQLTAGSAQLSSGMSKLYNDGIKKIVNLYNKKLKGIASDLSSVVKAGKGYRTFTILPSGMDGNVKFVYKTTISK